MGPCSVCGIDQCYGECWKSRDPSRVSADDASPTSLGDRVVALDREKAELRASLSALAREAGAIAERFEDTAHWEECDARPEDDENENADLSKCVCTVGALARIGALAKAALKAGG